MNSLCFWLVLVVVGSIIIFHGVMMETTGILEGISILLIAAYLGVFVSWK